MWEKKRRLRVLEKGSMYVFSERDVIHGSSLFGKQNGNERRKMAISHLPKQNGNSFTKAKCRLFQNKMVMRNKLCSNLSLVHHIKDAWRAEK